MKRFTQIFSCCFITFTFVFFNSNLKAQATPFYPVFQTTDRANIIMLGNVGGYCSQTATTIPTCCSYCNNLIANSLNPNYSASNNGGYQAVAVDIDSDPTTYMSSSDSLDLEICNEILFAGLYFLQEDSLISDTIINYGDDKTKKHNGFI